MISVSVTGLLGFNDPYMDQVRKGLENSTYTSQCGAFRKCFVMVTVFQRGSKFYFVLEIILCVYV